MNPARLIPPFLLLFACGSNPAGSADPPRLVQRSHVSMGSDVAVTAWTADAHAASETFDEVFREVDRLDALMSVWRPGSDILRLNEAAGRQRVTVSPEVAEAIESARQVSEWTGGGFDVTFGALSDIWKFDHDQDNRVPSSDDIRMRLPLVNYRALEMDASTGTAYLTRGGMRAHLGGIGKGFAVDRAAAILRSRGLHDFMIQFGGDLYVGGTRGSRPWHLGIRDPRGPADRSFAAMDLTDSSFSTSGDYERYFVRNGRRYHHIIDPRTGEPAQGCRSVTIVTPRAVLADALSTGVFVMGPSAGMALIERLPDVEGVIVTSENRVLVSSGLKGRLEMLASPTDTP
jgi:thiamine biosynthesis lipoprotein